MDSREFWDARYREKPESWGEDPNVFLKELELSGLSTAVDLAGGNGRNSLWLASNGLRVENVDISPVALEQFLERAEKSGVSPLCSTVVADATEAAFSFSPDLLVIAYLQLEKDQLSKAITNAFDQLKAGATVLGVWHAVENLERGFGGPPNKGVLVSESQLRELAATYQWSDLEIKNRLRVVQTDDGDKVAIDVVLFGHLAV